MIASRRGFTLVELLVSLVLIGVGLLALVGSSAVVVRAADEGRGRSAAVRAAVNRLESIGARPCVAASGTAVGEHGVHEIWVVELLGNGVREIRDSVTYLRAGRLGSLTLRTRTPC